MFYVPIVKRALGPLLLLQGRRVRRTAARMPEAVEYAVLIDVLMPDNILIPNNILIPSKGTRLAVVSGLPPLHIAPAVPQPLRWFLGLCTLRLDRRRQRWIRTRPGVSYLSLQWAADRSRLAEDGYHPGEGVYCGWTHRIAEQIVLHLEAG